MFSVETASLPADALLNSYALTDGCYTDCFGADVEGTIELPDFVGAFYVTRIFKLERLILRLFASISSTDEEAHQVASGDVDRFAAWHVEGRTERQLLMCDNSGRTRSWFAVEQIDGGSSTRLFFGSAVVPPKDAKPGDGLGVVFNALLGFHKLYSRLLLASARRRLTGHWL